MLASPSAVCWKCSGRLVTRQSTFYIHSKGMASTHYTFSFYTTASPIVRLDEVGLSHFPLPHHWYQSHWWYLWECPASLEVELASPVPGLPHSHQHPVFLHTQTVNCILVTTAILHTSISSQSTINPDRYRKRVVTNVELKLVQDRQVLMLRYVIGWLHWQHAIFITSFELDCLYRASQLKKVYMHHHLRHPRHNHCKSST